MGGKPLVSLFPLFHVKVGLGTGWVLEPCKDDPNRTLVSYVVHVRSTVMRSGHVPTACNPGLVSLPTINLCNILC